MPPQRACISDVDHCAVADVPLDGQAHIHYVLAFHVAIVAGDGRRRNEALRGLEGSNRAELDERILHQGIRVSCRIIDAERAVIEYSEAATDGRFADTEGIVRESNTRRRKWVEVVYQSVGVAGILGSDNQSVRGITGAWGDESNQGRWICSSCHRADSHACSIHDGWPDQLHRLARVIERG